MSQLERGNTTPEARQSLALASDVKGNSEIDSGPAYLIAPEGLVVLFEDLSPADAAVMETFVVPRYLSLFGELAMEMLLVGSVARILHVGCRTGYPDRRILERIEPANVVGFDGSAAAIELAKNKAAMLGAKIEYRVAREMPIELEAELYSHVLTLHPAVSSKQRGELFGDLAQLLYAQGQALIGLPLRGSFQEVLDLFREYALKSDDGVLGVAVESAVLQSPTIESLADELEIAHLSDVDVEIRQTELVFDSGRAFIEDPMTRLLILPSLQADLGSVDLTEPLEYVRDAIDKYWSEAKFGLTLNVGCASARKA
jgi:SAM-dependent methyltransferase